MSIIQISKIQQRSGDFVDLPQLDEAELGFATDEKRLFIGKTTGNIENVEVLTAYSPIAFSQIDGAVGNLDISADVGNGEVLTYDGNNWVNRGGNTGGYINLGQVANLAVLGGGSGYQLVTDGYGNLDWEPKGFVTLSIMNVTQANPAIIEFTKPFPLASAAQITVSGVQGNTDFTALNANVYYLKPIAGNSSQYEMYTDNGLIISFDTTGLTNAYPFTSVVQTISSNNNIEVSDSNFFANTNPVMFQGDLGNSGIVANFQYYIYGTPPDSTHIVISTSNDGNSANIVNLDDESSITANVFISSGLVSIPIGTTGTAAGGSNTQVQFNSGSILAGNPGLTYDFPNTIFTANNIVVTSTVQSNLIPNANVTFDLGNNTNRWNDLYLAGSTIYLGNASITSNSLGVVITNASGGEFIVGGSGTSNISSLVNGNSNVIVSANANITISSAGNANVVVVTGTGVNVAGTLNATGNANVGNLDTTGTITAATVTASTFAATNNGAGQNYKVGDDAWIGDINVSDTLSIIGVQSSGANGYIIFGNGDTTSTLGRAGTGPLTYNGAFNVLSTLYAPNISLNGNIVANLTNAGIELGNPSTVNTPYIDFHSSGNSSRNYDVRLISSGGGASDGLGTLTVLGTLNTTAITTGAVGQPGTIVGNWTLTSGSKLEATYADLAEYYAADNAYTSGIVLEFGGDEEVTVAGVESNRIAGVVSENPAYVMNSNLQATFPVVIALIGRVPVQVIGTVKKGDMLVSAGNGYAKSSSDPKLGTVIGKAIANKTNEEPGLVEVMVGRL